MSTRCSIALKEADGKVRVKEFLHEDLVAPGDWVSIHGLAEGDVFEGKQGRVISVDSPTKDDAGNDITTVVVETTISTESGDQPIDKEVDQQNVSIINQEGDQMKAEKPVGNGVIEDDFDTIYNQNEEPVEDDYPTVESLRESLDDDLIPEDNDPNEEMVYQFPSNMREPEALQLAKAYDLKIIPDSQMENSEDNKANDICIKGSRANLTDFADELAGYELVDEYLCPFEDFGYNYIN